MKDKCCVCGETKQIAQYTRRGVICADCMGYYHEHHTWPKKPEPIIFGRNDKPSSPFAYTPEGRPIDISFYLQHCKVEGVIERCEYCLTVDEVEKHDPFTGKPVCAECAKNNASVKPRPIYNPAEKKAASKPKKSNQHKNADKKLLVEEALDAGIFTAAEIVEYAHCSVDYVYVIDGKRVAKGKPSGYKRCSNTDKAEKMAQQRWDEYHHLPEDKKEKIIQDILSGKKDATQIAQEHNIKRRRVYAINCQLKREGKNPKLIMITPQERIAKTNEARYGNNKEEIARAKSIIRDSLKKGGMTVEQIRQVAGNCNISLVNNEIHRMKKEGLNPLFLKKRRDKSFFSTATQKVIDCLAKNPHHGLKSVGISALTELKVEYVNNIISDLRKISVIKTVKGGDGQYYHYLARESVATPKAQTQNTINPDPSLMSETEKVEYVIRNYGYLTNSKIAKNLDWSYEHTYSIIVQCKQKGIIPKNVPPAKIDWNLLTQKYKK